MKKLISLLLAIALAFPSSGAKYFSAIVDREVIDLSYANEQGDDRSGAEPVKACLYHSTNTLYIAFVHSVGSATITVTNSDGVTVYSSVVDATLVGFTQFVAPATQGSYTLTVSSASYYGIGSFSI